MSVTQQDRVVELAAEILDSFEKLDILLRLERSPAAIGIEALVAELAIARPELADALDELVRDGVLRCDDSGYAIVRDGPWASHVTALAELHRSDRMEVVTLMSKASVERLRKQAARAFADAFVLRPKKGDGDG